MKEPPENQWPRTNDVIEYWAWPAWWFARISPIWQEAISPVLDKLAKEQRLNQKDTQEK